MTEKLHHALGASNAERWTNCTGSPRLIAQAPSEPPSFFAAEGTAAHIVAEVALLSALGRPIPAELTVRHKDKIKVGDQEIEVTDEMIECARIWVETIKSFAQKYNIPEYLIATERKVKIPMPDDMGDLWGTLDARLYAPYERLIVLDYKYGKGTKVDAQDNKQLKYYALGSLFGLPEDEREQLQTVEICIVQPRVYGGGVHSVEIPSRELLSDFYSFLVAKAAITLSNDANLVAGEWCRWCPAKPICPEIQRFAVDQLRTEFATVAKPPLPEIQALTTEQAVGILKHKKLIEEYLEAAVGFFKERAQTDFAFREELEKLGYVLAQGRLGNREWVDEAEVIKRVAPRLPKENFIKTKLFTPTQLEEVLKKQGLDIKIDDLITQKPPGVALVQNGPKVKKIGNMQKEFAAIEVKNNGN